MSTQTARRDQPDLRGGRTPFLTHFPEALVLVDAAVEGDGGVRGLLQAGVGRVGRLRVLLDGLQEQGVAGDPLHGHHQEEAQRRGVDLRPGGGENVLRLSVSYHPSSTRTSGGGVMKVAAVSLKGDTLHHQVRV